VHIRHRSKKSKDKVVEAELLTESKNIFDIFNIWIVRFLPVGWLKLLVMFYLIGKIKLV